MSSPGAQKLVKVPLLYPEGESCLFTELIAVTLLPQAGLATPAVLPSFPAAATTKILLSLALFAASTTTSFPSHRVLNFASVLPLSKAKLKLITVMLYEVEFPIHQSIPCTTSPVDPPPLLSSALNAAMPAPGAMPFICPFPAIIPAICDPCPLSSIGSPSSGLFTVSYPVRTLNPAPNPPPKDKLL